MSQNLQSFSRLTALVAAALASACGGGGGSGGSDPVAAPSISAQPASTTVTELQPASFNIAATGAAPLSYQWLRNGTPIAGATSPTLTISSTLPADHSARYSAVVSNSAGAVTSADAVLTQELPMFLLGGQSNMVGSTDRDLYKQLLADLESGTDAETTKTDLAKRITDWSTAITGYEDIEKTKPQRSRIYGYSASMAALEASELVRLKSLGLVGNFLNTPSTNVFCSANESALVPLQALIPEKVECASPVGPEHVFGRALGKAGHSSTSVIKVAYGGTTLHDDWRSPSMGGTPNTNDHYAKLRTRIKSLKTNPASVNPMCKTRTCQWSAFVWFQGESDSFNKVHGEAYGQNLKNFIADVRAEAGLPTLPVVIVQIGAWGQSISFGKNVSSAQTAWVNADKYARIVNTADLNGYFHYDPAAQLIIGERVYLAVQSLLAAAPAAK